MNFSFRYGEKNYTKDDFVKAGDNNIKITLPEKRSSTIIKYYAK